MFVCWWFAHNQEWHWREIDEFKVAIKYEFENIDLGNLSYFLGIEFVITKEGMALHQQCVRATWKVCDEWL
jgi:hypothetical protein